MPGVIVIKAEN